MLKAQPNFKVLLFNLVMMLFAWTAMSFGSYLLVFYTKHLPGEVYSNTMFIGFASLIFILAGPLSIRM